MGFLDWLKGMLTLPGRRQLVGKSPKDPQHPKQEKTAEVLGAELDAAQKQFEELARAHASLLNDQKGFRQRLHREQARCIDLARAKIALHLIEVGDELDRALAATAGGDDPLAQGVRLIAEGLQKRLRDMGIERLSLVGKAFDPIQADAIEVAPVSAPEDDEKVLEEFLPGFRMGDQILRPARVKVGRHRAPDRKADEDAGAPCEAPADYPAGPEAS